jgi:hypothetical protein
MLPFKTMFLLISLLVLTPFVAYGQKVHFELGAYSIHAEPPKDSTAAVVSLSGFGTYSVSANFRLRDPFEIGVGYTVFYAKAISGDMGFGPDFYLYYFPLNEGSGRSFQGEGVSFREIQQWRPYVDIAFHQRQFQSVESAYSGFGLGGGVEWQWTDNSGLRAGIRTMSLAGPSNAKLSYFDVLFGYQLQFH